MFSHYTDYDYVFMSSRIKKSLELSRNVLQRIKLALEVDVTDPRGKCWLTATKRVN
jgi:hypothetical protein